MFKDEAKATQWKKFQLRRLNKKNIRMYKNINRRLKPRQEKGDGDGTNYKIFVYEIPT